MVTLSATGSVPITLALARSPGTRNRVDDGAGGFIPMSSTPWPVMRARRREPGARRKPDRGFGVP